MVATLQRLLPMLSDSRASKILQDQISNILIQSVDGALSCEFTRKLKGSIQRMGGKGPITVDFDYSKAVDSPEYFLYLSFGVAYDGE